MTRPRSPDKVQTGHRSSASTGSGSREGSRQLLGHTAGLWASSAAQPEILWWECSRVGGPLAVTHDDTSSPGSSAFPASWPWARPRAVLDSPAFGPSQGDKWPCLSVLASPLRQPPCIWLCLPPLPKTSEDPSPHIFNAHPFLSTYYAPPHLRHFIFPP